jgi:hypothetical protein
MLLLLVTVACGREPVAPAAEPAVPAANAASTSSASTDADGWPALELIGAGDLSFPPDNDWSRTDWNQWKPTGIETGPGWIYLRVQGGIDYVWNPGCDDIPPGAEPCPGTPGEEGTSGPWGTLARVVIGFSNSGSTTINREGVGAAFVPAGDTMTSGLLVHRGGAGTIHTERQMQLGGASSSGASIGVPQYLLSGIQTLSVEQVPEPVRIGAPAAVRPGDYLQATIEPRPPFRLRSPSGNPPIAWAYRTVTGYTYSLWECAGRQTCSYRPPRDGHFIVSTYVETNPIRVNSHIIRRTDGILELTCSTPLEEGLVRSGQEAPRVRLTRGEELGCSVGSYPAGLDVRVTGWSFEGDAFSRAAGEEELATSWGGPIVTGGRVSVAALVKGVEQSVAMDVSVLPRDWSDRRVAVVTRRVAASHDRALPVRPRGDFHLANTIFQARALPATTAVERGPNRGLSFLQAIPFEVEALVLLNGTALQEESEFYHLQAPDRPGSNNSWPECSKSAVPRLPPHVLAHEGIPMDPTPSHIGAYQQELDRRIGGTVGQIEAAVGEAAVDLQAEYSGILEQVHRSASDAAIRLHESAAGVFTPVDANGSSCALQYHFDYS